ncbi:sensor histidine kinase [Phyllobacterium phragmitis]|uniref:histidine kinase n=1 Tax=Phyllobacterium phragmitis TaxID=2670329 RepID=A0ABQ0H3R3_9HYPH
MTRREPSLFWRLALRVALVLCTGAALLITAAWVYARAAADDAYDRLLLGAAIQIAENLTVDAGHLIINLPSSAFELLGLAASDRIFYRVIDPAGQTLTGYDDLKTDIDLDTVRAEPVFASTEFRGVPVRLTIVARALSDPTLSGFAHVIVAQTTEARRALAGELTSHAIVLVAIMSVLALAGTMLAIRYSLQPIAHLGAAMRRRDPQDLTPIKVEAPRELQPFLASINHFMGRLNERVDLLQRFIADAAHQIRTPLTALSAQVDLLGQDQMDESGRRHLARVKKRADELARLTNQLLSHAMVIHRSESVQLAPVNLVDIARRAFRAAIPITIDPDIVVSFEAQSEAPMVLGDPVSLREAIVNVIDNSLRHGTISRLEVRVVSDREKARVEVEDDGVGIPPGEWERVTQRFVTSRAHEGSGGLGFAIASEVATAHGGRLGFREKGERGFTVYLEIPLAGQAEVKKKK